MDFTTLLPLEYVGLQGQSKFIQENLQLLATEIYGKDNVDKTGDGLMVRNKNKWEYYRPVPLHYAPVTEMNYEQWWHVVNAVMLDAHVSYLAGQVTIRFTYPHGLGTMIFEIESEHYRHYAFAVAFILYLKRQQQMEEEIHSADVG